MNSALIDDIRVCDCRDAVCASEPGSPGMSYAVEQTRRFARQYKKLHDNVAADVDSAIERVAVESTIGDLKKGDLAELLVYKFRRQGQPYVLGYSLDDAVRLVYLEAIGSRENSGIEVQWNGYAELSIIVLMASTALCGVG